MSKIGSIKFNFFDFLGRKVEAPQSMLISQETAQTQAFKELALHIAISYYANTFSKCELKVYEQNKEVKNQLYYLLNVSPNPNESASEFKSKIVERYFYDGGALVVPKEYGNLFVADSFVVDDLTPLSGYKFKSVSFGTETQTTDIDVDNAYYFKLNDKNVKRIIDDVYFSYGAVIAQAISAYKRTNGNRYIITHSRAKAGTNKLNKDLEEIVKNDFDEFLKKDNCIYHQYEGNDLKEFSTKPPQTTADIVSARKEIFETTAQAFMIPNAMMLGNINNINDVVEVFLTFGFEPHAYMFGNELTRKYYGYDGWSKGNYIKVDTSCIKHTDILSVASAIFNAIGSGAFTIDDIRKLAGWSPLGTELSTQHWVTKNFVKAEDALTGEAKGGE